MNYRQAETVARAWIEAVEPRFELCLEGTITRPYGWVFVFRPVPGSPELTGGPSFILLDRINGELRVFGSGDIPEVALARYEASIPDARLKMRPEFPPNMPEERDYRGRIDPRRAIDDSALDEDL